MTLLKASLLKKIDFWWCLDCVYFVATTNRSMEQHILFCFMLRILLSIERCELIPSTCSTQAWVVIGESTCLVGGKSSTPFIPNECATHLPCICAESGRRLKSNNQARTYCMHASARFQTYSKCKRRRMWLQRLLLQLVQLDLYLQEKRLVFQ
jgi:hypothetical protein